MDLDNITNIAIKYNEAIKALKEIVYNDNPAPAKELLRDVSPVFSENHITPHQFISLERGCKEILRENIPCLRGDIFYSVKDNEFLVLIDSKTLRSLDSVFDYTLDSEDSDEVFIPCYSVHQLWGFLEKCARDYRKEGKVTVLANEDGYSVVIPKLHTLSYDTNLRSGRTKLDALWYSVIALIGN